MASPAAVESEMVALASTSSTATQPTTATQSGAAVAALAAAPNPPSPPFECNEAYCNSVKENDCCAPSLELGHPAWTVEDATCSNEKVPVRTGKSCNGYDGADYVCCTFEAPPPVPKPPPPPPGPHQPPYRGRVVDLVNKRFAGSKKPSGDLDKAGVLMHQFDTIEVKGRPWEFCTGQRCYMGGQWIPGRISSMLIYSGMRDRKDRVAIPLPFKDRGGLIFNPFEVEIQCMYGVDGSALYDPSRVRALSRL